MLIKTRTGKRSHGAKSRAPERVSEPRAHPGGERVVGVRPRFAEDA